MLAIDVDHARLAVEPIAASDPVDAYMSLRFVGGLHQMQVTAGCRLPRFHGPLRQFRIVGLAAAFRMRARFHPIAQSSGGERSGEQEDGEQFHTFGDQNGSPARMNWIGTSLTN